MSLRTSLPAFVMLFVLAAPLRAEDEPKASPHETLRKELVAAWHAQGDFVLRYEITNDAKDRDVTKRAVLHVCKRGERWGLRAAEEQDDGGALLAVATPNRLMADFGPGRELTALGTRHVEARRLRLRDAWQRGVAELGIVGGPTPFTNPFGSAIDIGVEPKSNGTTRFVLAASVESGDRAPSWLDDDLWSSHAVAVEEDGRAVRLTDALTSVRVERSTGRPLAFACKRTKDDSTTWIRFTQEVDEHDAFASLFREVEDAPPDMQGIGINTALWAHAMRSGLEALHELGHDVLVRPETERHLIEPLADALHSGYLIDFLTWHAAEGVCAFIDRQGGFDAVSTEVLAARLEHTAREAQGRFRQGVEHVLQEHTAAHALAPLLMRFDEPLRRRWRKAIEERVATEQERRALVRAFRSLDERAYDMRWEALGTTSNHEPVPVVFWTAGGRFAFRWSQRGHAVTVYASPKRTIHGEAPAEGTPSPDPFVGEGWETYASLHARRTALIEACLARGDPLTGGTLRPELPTLAITPRAWTAAGPGPHPVFHVEEQAAATPGWLTRNVWSRRTITARTENAIVLSDGTWTMRLERATGLPLEVRVERNRAVLRIVRVRPRTVDASLRSWVAAQEQAPLTKASLHTLYEATERQAADVVFVVCSGCWTDASEADRRAFAKRVVAELLPRRFLAYRLKERHETLLDNIRTWYAELTPEQQAQASRAYIRAKYLPGAYKRSAGVLLDDVLEAARGAAQRNEDVTFDEAMATLLLEEAAAMIERRIGLHVEAGLVKLGLR